jgi:uncharacterized protein (TIGR02266 family)
MTSQSQAAAKKRRHPRVDMEIPAELISASQTIEVAIGNLGPEGAFIKCSRKPEAGTRVKLAFKISSHPLPFNIEAEVRWLKDGADGGIGVHFIDFPPFDRAALDDFCQHRLEEVRGASSTAS